MAKKKLIDLTEFIAMCSIECAGVAVHVPYSWKLRCTKHRSLVQKRVNEQTVT